MNPQDALVGLLENNTWLLSSYLEDMEGAELLQQLPNGGQHALWLIAHILWAEDGAINGWVLRRPPTLSGKFLSATTGTHALADASKYPSKGQLLEALAAVRQNTVSAIRGTPVERWGDPTPEGAFFKTIGQTFFRGPVHATFHTGQLATIRRMLGKPGKLA